MASWTTRQLKDFLKERDLPCRGDRVSLEVGRVASPVRRTSSFDLVPGTACCFAEPCVTLPCSLTPQAVALERIAEERAAADEVRQLESIWAEVLTWKKKELQARLLGKGSGRVLACSAGGS